MDLPSSLAATFHWWRNIFSDPRQAKTIRSTVASQEIYSDASLSNWGASCGDLRTHGWWSEEEKLEHINFLEHKAAFYALRCLTSDVQDSYILLRIDNTTALSYVNRFGSVQYPHLTALAKQIWGWCEERNNFVFASYIASIDNSLADLESRTVSVDTEWSLSQDAFSQLSAEFGPFEIDLFASIIR